MPAAVDLTGQRFGRLVAIGAAGTRNGRVHWLCACDCGGTKIANSNVMRAGKVRSCGCLANETRRANGRLTNGAPPKHGLHGIPEYNIWKTMRRRASGKGSEIDRELYAGVTCCERWASFQNFYDDMGPRPTPAHSLDRRDNGGNYEPDNCRWATVTEQANNRRVRRWRRRPTTTILLKEESVWQ